MPDVRAHLKQAAHDTVDVGLTASQLASFQTYHDLLLEWNKKMNLTAITDPDEVVTRHFVDSLSVAPVLEDIPPGGRLIDIGTGAGFPGLALAILRPDLSISLADSVGKKVSFLQHVIDVLSLSHVDAYHARAEELGQDPAHREAYHVAVARAVAGLPVLAEYLLPLLRIGGLMVAQKGESAQCEVEQAAHAFDMLGGRLDRVERVDLTGVPEPHYLVIVDKVGPSPDKYPRRAGMPTKRPLQ